MVIRLSPTVQKLVERESKARGIKPAKLVEETLKEHLTTKRKPREQVSEARRQLRLLLKHKKKTVDFDAAVHAAKRAGGKLIEDNQDWIDSVMARSTQHPKG